MNRLIILVGLFGAAYPLAADIIVPDSHRNESAADSEDTVRSVFDEHFVNRDSIEAELQKIRDSLLVYDCGIGKNDQRIFARSHAHFFAMALPLENVLQPRRLASVSPYDSEYALPPNLRGQDILVLMTLSIGERRDQVHMPERGPIWYAN